LKEHLDQRRRSAVEKYNEQANTTGTLSEASDIIAAAHAGQIDQLLVNSTATLPGEFDPADRSIDYHASTTDYDKDLVEDTIAQTLLHRGDVYAISENEMPANQPMVATLRF
jgi:hypothetical protein